VLEALSDATIEEMACNILRVRELPERLGDFLATHSQGRPFIAVQMLRALVEAGQLSVQRGRCLCPFVDARFDIDPVGSALATPINPALAKEAGKWVVARMGVLPYAQRRILLLIATTGCETPLSFVRDVYPAFSLDDADEQGILFALRSVISSGLVTYRHGDDWGDHAGGEKGQRGLSTYFSTLGANVFVRLAHRDTRAAILATVPPQDVSTMHHAAALWFQNATPFSHQRHHALSLLAYHWVNSRKDPATATTYLKKAIQRCRALNCEKECAAWIAQEITVIERDMSKVWTLDATKRRLIDLHHLAAEAHVKLCNTSEARRHCELLLAILNVDISSGTGVIASVSTALWGVKELARNWVRMNR
jgi:hypothetical protein